MEQLATNEPAMRYDILKNGGDFVIARCTACTEIFYSSPCGEENVAWNAAKRCLETICPNHCYSAPGVRSE